MAGPSVFYAFSGKSQREHTYSEKIRKFIGLNYK